MAERRAARGRWKAHAAGWAAWGLLSIAATIMQNAPDLLEWLPNELIWALVAIGAVAQLPFIVRDVRKMGEDELSSAFWREGHGDNLLHPEPDFVGYTEQRQRTARLFARFDRDGWRGAVDRLRWWKRPGPQTPPLVVVVTGAPGTGKSQLANLIARETADRFPDGTRWIDLTMATSPDGDGAPDGTADGAAPQRPGAWIRVRDVLSRRVRRTPEVDGADEPEPVSRARSVHALLEELLGASGDTPRGPRRHLEEAWRGRTAGRRLLLVLENAEDPARVSALLPNSPYSAVLVTARVPFREESFYYIEEHLEGLTDEEGAELLDRTAPPQDPADPEERAARRALARFCNGLPLALKMCGKRLASHTGEDAAQLLDKVRSTHGTPLLGSSGFPASFLGVFRLCGTSARRLLHRMAVCGLQDVSDYAAAAFLDTDRAAAADVLQELVDRSLLEPLGRADDGVHRYRMHQLVRGTLIVLGPDELDVPEAEAEAEWSQAAVDAAAHRLVAAYAWTVRVAAAGLHRADRGFPDPPLAGPGPGPKAAAWRLEQPEAPAAWLHREREVLLGCIWLAADAGHLGLAWRLARAVADMCQALRTHWEEWDQAVDAQLALAHGGGDAQALGMALLDASELAGARGQYQQGMEYARKAQMTFQALHADERWIARARRVMGVCRQRWGDLAEAQEELERAEEVLARRGELWWRARTLVNLAELHADRERWSRARTLLGEAFAVFEDQEDPAQADQTRIMLAEVLADEGSHLPAWVALHPLLKRFRDEQRYWYAAQCLRILGGLNGALLRRRWRAAGVALRSLERAERRSAPPPRAHHAPAETTEASAPGSPEVRELSERFADLVGGPGAARVVRSFSDTRQTERMLRRAWSSPAREAQLQEAIVLMQRMGDEWGVHRTRLSLGRMLARDRDFDRAGKEFAAAAAGFAGLGELRWQARTHHMAAEEILGAVSPSGAGPDTTVPQRFARAVQFAVEHAEKAVSLYGARNNTIGLATAGILLARLHWVDGAPHPVVTASLARIESQASAAGLSELASEARELQGGLSGDADIARLWPIH